MRGQGSSRAPPSVASHFAVSVSPLFPSGAYVLVEQPCFVVRRAPEHDPDALPGASAAGLLIVLTALFAVLFAGHMPASAQSSDTWSATMTVGSSNRGNTDTESVGYGLMFGQFPEHGSITDNTFSTGGNAYTVTAVAYGPRSPSGLKLVLNRALPAGLSAPPCDSEFSVSDADRETAGGFTVYSGRITTSIGPTTPWLRCGSRLPTPSRRSPTTRPRAAWRRTPRRGRTSAMRSRPRTTTTTR